MTDSLSAVQALTSPHYSKHYLVTKIALLLSNIHPQKIKIQWIPSHKGIPGNERADTLAKNALSLPYVTYNLCNTMDAKRIIKSHYYKKYKDFCNPCLHNTTISYTYSLSTPPILSTPRFYQTVLCRLLHLTTA